MKAREKRFEAERDAVQSCEQGFEISTLTNCFSSLARFWPFTEGFAGLQQQWPSLMQQAMEQTSLLACVASVTGAATATSKKANTAHRARSLMNKFCLGAVTVALL